MTSAAAIIDTSTGEILNAPLTTAEAQQLAAHEATIRDGFDTFVAVGTALMAIRDARLYREEFATFEDYCQQRWDMSRPRAYQLIEAANVATNLSTNGRQIDPPANERQARPLTELAPDEQVIAWEVVRQTAPAGRITAAHVKSVVNVLKEVTRTGAIDDGTGEQIPITQATLDHLKAAVTEETYERTKRQEAYIAEKQQKEAERAERQARRNEAADKANAAQEQFTQTAYKHGDMVLLGDHLLICGDNRDTRIRSLMQQLGRPMLAFCDPPYNAGVAEWDAGDFEWQQDFLVKSAHIVAVTPGIGNLHAFMRLTAMPYRWSVSCHISNGMTRGALGFGNWIYTALFSEHESLHRSAQDIAVVPIVGTQDAQGAKRQKPTRYLSWLFDLLTQKGEVILDPFAGSGTSAIVAAGLGRKSVSVEIDPVTFAGMVARVSQALAVSVEAHHVHAV